MRELSESMADSEGASDIDGAAAKVAESDAGAERINGG